MRLPLVLCCLAAVVPATLAAAERPAMRKPIMVWDGESAATGDGWAKAGGDKPASIAAGAGEAASGTTALRLHLEGEHWVRGGWRWVKPDSNVGFNAKPFAFFYLVMKTAKAQMMPEDIAIQLVASGPDGARQEGPAVNLSAIAPKALGGGKAWIEIAIPVAALTAARDFDATNVTEVMFVANGGKAMHCDLVIDNIGFAKGQK